METGAFGGLHGEVYGGDDGVLQFARRFLWILAYVMCGGVSVCLAIWAQFVIGSSLNGLYIIVLLL